MVSICSRAWKGSLSRVAALVVVAGAVLAVLTAGPAMAASNTKISCTQRTNAFGWINYSVCLTANYSWDGTRAAGYVAGTSCNVDLPTGAGFNCWGGKRSSGAYWNAALGAQEEWLNWSVLYLSPVWPLNRNAFQDCVYVRIDTWPSGITKARNWINSNLSLLVSC